MKKLFSLFLVLVMLLGLIGTVYADGETPTFVVSEATAAPGDTVRVTISIQNNPNVASIQLEPQYDHNILEWIDVEQGDYTGTWNPRVDKGFVNWYGPSGHNVDFDGVFATLVFKVNENAPAGETAVTVTYDEENVFDQYDNNIYFDIQAGKVTVVVPETAYYLIGSMTDWQVNEAYKFVENPNSAGEYMLDTTLAVGDEFKAVSATGTTTNTWYPDGMDNNYVVDEAHSGNVTVYFRPDYTGGEDWHYNCLYIAVSTEPSFKTHSLVLSGSIGVNFFMDLPTIEGVDWEDSYMTFEISGKGSIAPEQDNFDPDDKDLTSGKYYGFTAYVNAIQMADTITATFHWMQNGEDKSIFEEYSIEQYVIKFHEVLAENPNAADDTTVALVEALADYGYYAQIFLEKNRNWSFGDDDNSYKKMETHYRESFDMSEIEVDDHGIAVENAGNLFSKVSFSLVLDSETALRYYVTPKDEVAFDDLTITCTGEKEPTWKQSGKRYIVQVPNISAHQLSTKYTLTIGDATFTASGLSYVKMMLTAYENDNDALNAAAAIYHYSAAANAYKNAH